MSVHNVSFHIIPHRRLHIHNRSEAYKEIKWNLKVFFIT